LDQENVHENQQPTLKLVLEGLNYVLWISGGKRSNIT